MNAVYRHFDENGVLLYVGSSAHIKVRTQAHSNKSTWFGQVRTITIAPMSSYEEALKAETEAIKSESPRYNVMGRLIPMPKPPIKHDCLMPYQWDHKELKAMTAERKDAILKSPLSCSKLGRIFNLNCDTVRFLRGQEAEYKIDFQRYEDRMCKYLENQEKIARAEMAEYFSSVSK